MTPDDTPVEGDDAIARAARDGLRHLAGSHAPIRLDWDGVRVRARRVRQRRVAAVVAACAIVIASAGAAVAATGHNRDRDRVSIAGQGGAVATTTTTTPSTSEPSSTTTTPTPSTSAIPPISGGIEGTTTTLPGTVAQPSDLQGTLTLTSTTLTAEQPTAFTLTVRNVTDHTIQFPSYPEFGVSMTTADPFGFRSVAVSDIGLILGPGQGHTFDASITPDPAMVGSSVVSAAFLGGSDPPDGPCCNVPFIVAGVPSVPITVVPPGWTPGQPLDPSQGTWNAAMSAAAAQVHVGETIRLTATLRNIGDAAQLTEGYGSLAIVCRQTDEAASYWTRGEFVGISTVQPGTAQEFSIAFRPDNGFEGTAACSVGLAFHGDANNAGTRAGLDSDAVTFTILPSVTATTLSDTTTTTTSAP